MDNETTEQSLRREAIRRFLEGERVCDIIRALGRSRSWFDKWRGEYERDPQTDLASRSRAPHTSPHEMPPHVVAAAVKVRQALEAADRPNTRYGLIGHGAVRGEMERLKITPLPSSRTTQRILSKHGLTHPRGAASDTAYYPAPMAEAPNEIQATDIITRHIRGGEVVQNFHTFDHYSHMVHLSQYARKTTDMALGHLLDTWQDLGLPTIHQFDNEDCFSGGHTHTRVIGRVVRLCLFVGVESLFIPVREPKRNYQVEGFHSLWLKAFWSRHAFGDLADVQAEAPIFLDWYHNRYRPPSLDGKSPAQMRRGFGRLPKLTLRLRRLIPDPLPVTEGRIHIIRKVDVHGDIRILNETWSLGQKWSGEYVWTIVDTAHQRLAVWHQPSADEPMVRIRTFPFKLKHPVLPLQLPFRRKCPRCPGQWVS